MLSLAHLLPLLHPCAIYIDLLVQEAKSPISHACFQNQFVSLVAPMCH